MPDELEELAELSELVVLDELDELKELDELDKLEMLDEVEELAALDELDELELKLEAMDDEEKPEPVPLDPLLPPQPHSTDSTIEMRLTSSIFFTMLLSFYNQLHQRL